MKLKVKVKLFRKSNQGVVINKSEAIRSAINLPDLVNA